MPFRRCLVSGFSLLFEFHFWFLHFSQTLGFFRETIRFNTPESFSLKLSIILPFLPFSPTGKVQLPCGYLRGEVFPAPPRSIFSGLLPVCGSGAREIFPFGVGVSLGLAPPPNGAFCTGFLKDPSASLGGTPGSCQNPYSLLPPC